MVETICIHVEFYDYINPEVYNFETDDEEE